MDFKKIAKLIKKRKRDRDRVLGIDYNNIEQTIKIIKHRLSNYKGMKI